uniref:Uncharacterized protein n=1 Tax=Arundo donax TaxID=35708 RepID=A0A0A9ER09_ARUDO
MHFVRIAKAWSLYIRYTHVKLAINVKFPWKWGFLDLQSNVFFCITSNSGFVYFSKGTSAR